jgi:hypothetical protein
LDAPASEQPKELAMTVIIRSIGVWIIDRCGGETLHTVCSECVGSGFSDIGTCGACAYCLGF